MGRKFPRWLKRLLRFHQIRQNRRSLIEVDLVDAGIGPASVSILARIVHQNSTVQTLWLSENNIGDIGADNLATALQHNHNIRHLIIGSNNIKQKGAKSFGTLLREPEGPLQTLCMGGNDIGDEGACSIASALLCNQSMKELWLKHNGIGSKGITMLANATRKNSVLEEIWLGGNSAGDHGAIAFATALSCNSTLRVLDLSQNSIGNNGASALRDALKVNHQIVELSIDGNPTDDEIIVSEINSLVEINKTGGSETQKLQMKQLFYSVEGENGHPNSTEPQNAGIFPN